MPHDRRHWASTEQRNWLTTCIPDYSEAQKKGRYDKYWHQLFQDYFAAFPPDDPTEDDPTDSENDADSECDAPLDSAEEEQLAATPLGKRKKKQAEQKTRKRAKKVSRFTYTLSILTYLDPQETKKKTYTRKERAAGYFIYKRKKVRNPTLSKQYLILTLFNSKSRLLCDGIAHQSQDQ